MCDWRGAGRRSWCCVASPVAGARRVLGRWSSWLRRRWVCRLDVIVESVDDGITSGGRVPLHGVEGEWMMRAGRFSVVTMLVVAAMGVFGVRPAVASTAMGVTGGALAEEELI